MRAEGTAGKDPYNVVLGNGRYGLPGKPLTSMTLAEAYQFGRTVRARHGSSSAIGAFQIVGQTMKTFMGEAGLGWDDKFSPENQRKLADLNCRRSRLPRPSITSTVQAVLTSPLPVFHVRLRTAATLLAHADRAASFFHLF